MEYIEGVEDMVLGLYFGAMRVFLFQLLKGAHRPKFQDWSRYSCDSMTKEELVFYCSTAWPVCSLDNGQEWPLNGSLTDYTLIQ